MLDVCENCGYVSVLHSREGYFRETQKVIYSLYFSQMFKVKRNNAGTRSQIRFILQQLLQNV